MVVDVVVAVAAQPDEVVDADVRDVVVAVAQHFDEIAGAGGVDVVVAVAGHENHRGVGVGHVDVVVAVAAHAKELSRRAGISGVDVVVAAADVDDKLADVADRDALLPSKATTLTVVAPGRLPICTLLLPPPRHTTTQVTAEKVPLPRLEATVAPPFAAGVT